MAAAPESKEEIPDDLEVSSPILDKDNETDPDFDITSNRRVLNTSRRISGNYHNIATELTKTRTNEDECRILFESMTDFEDDTIGLILELTDICPSNRIKNFKLSTFQSIIENIDELDHRWTLGHRFTEFPKLKSDQITGIYFAADRDSYNSKLYQIVGVIRDPSFLPHLKINTKSDKWDPCWDIYFYIRTSSELNRGVVIFSSVWSNMLIFGIDSDQLRTACESGNWDLTTLRMFNPRAADMVPIESDVSVTIEDTPDVEAGIPYLDEPNFSPDPPTSMTPDPSE